jgi:protoheme IX farnesyltransferase
MIGWAAVTGDVSLASIALFLIIFMWTPPHFWALSLYREGDYAKAGVPMMPVVAGQRSTKLQMLVYTLILCPLTLAPVFLGVSGWVYGAASIVLNLGFVGHAVRVLKSDDLRHAKRMFGFSLLYLFLHFALLCIDRAPGILPLIQGMLR